MVNGVSVVICAHNSSRRISPTLAHLAAQQVPDTLSWEVLLIDNGSIDDTAAIAQREWTVIVPLRIIHESKLGLSHARWRGIHEAKYDIISFVDDDNWLSPNWIATVIDIMIQHPEVGACGGHIDGVFENEPPLWFHQFAGWYTITQQEMQTGDVTKNPYPLVGAGLSIRRDALLALKEQGFSSLLTDRKGASLSSGGDTEMCLALGLAGWRLWFDNRLRLQHFMPATRLKWTYLRHMVRAIGMSSIMLEGYHVLLNQDLYHMRGRFKYTWIGQIVRFLATVVRNYKKSMSYLFNRDEGNPDTIWMEWRIGRIVAIVKQRQEYNTNLALVYNAKWLTKSVKSREVQP